MNCICRVPFTVNSLDVMFYELMIQNDVLGILKYTYIHVPMGNGHLRVRVQCRVSCGTNNLCLLNDIYRCLYLSVVTQVSFCCSKLVSYCYDDLL